MTITQTPIRPFDRHIAWRTPDSPQTVFAFPYYLRAGEQSWMELQDRLAQLHADRFFLISEAGIPTSIRDLTRGQVGDIAPCTSLLFEGKEETKNLLTVNTLAEEALKAGATRSSVFLALGGGLAGNVVGLLSALLFRGTRFVQLPTTLLAMSDSVLSLKQGVNSSRGKNHTGLFHAPAFVWSNLDFLKTLARDETRAALCELVKNVLLCPQYLEEVARALRTDADYDPAQIARFIEICIEAKCLLMAEDALEKHRAVSLELGHTIGHALELAVPGGLTHGLAVGIGLIVEATISHSLGLLSDADLQTHYRLLRANGAFTAIPSHEGYRADRLFSYLAKDNKRGYLPPQPGMYDMVLLKSLGEPNMTGDTVLTQVAHADIQAALVACH